MSKKQNFILLLTTTIFFVSACTSPLSLSTEEAVIVGTTEFPDPIREEILSLQNEGRLEILAEMESFPIQYRVRANEDVIEDLQNYRNELRDRVGD